MVSLTEYEAASEAGYELSRTQPFAVSVRFFPDIERLMIELSSHMELLIDPALIQGLRGAKRTDLSSIIIEGEGYSLRWPNLNVDIYLPELLKGVTGNASWMESSNEQRKEALTTGSLSGEFFVSQLKSKVHSDKGVLVGSSPDISRINWHGVIKLITSSAESREYATPSPADFARRVYDDNLYVTPALHIRSMNDSVH